jgi:hypothetical protein
LRDNAGPWINSVAADGPPTFATSGSCWTLTLICSADGCISYKQSPFRGLDVQAWCLSPFSSLRLSYLHFLCFLFGPHLKLFAVSLSSFYQLHVHYYPLRTVFIMVALTYKFLLLLPFAAAFVQAANDWSVKCQGECSYDTNGTKDRAFASVSLVSLHDLVLCYIPLILLPTCRLPTTRKSSLTSLPPRPGNSSTVPPTGPPALKTFAWSALLMTQPRIATM